MNEIERLGKQIATECDHEDSLIRWNARFALAAAAGWTLVGVLVYMLLR